jgi:putative ABC transport system permease protein
MQTLRQDLRHAMRMLGRQRGFTTVTVLTLALGVGGATAIFSVADAVVLRPLPMRDPDALFLLRQSDLKRNQPFIEISYPAFSAWRDRSRSFEAMAAMPSVDLPFILTGRGEPAVLEGRWVTASFFDMLGAAAALGRTLRAEDDRPGAPRVVVLSDALWRERFGADPAVVGRTLTLDDTAHTVVGVMPPSFAYPQRSELWTAMGASAPPELLEQAGVMWMLVLGRLRPGVTLDAARAELDGLWRGAYQGTGDVSGYAVRPVPIAESILGRTRPALLALLAGVGLVLLIACANVAGLLIVQTMERRSELAVRQALGASRLRLARTLLTESGLLAFAGGALGVGAAFWATPLLVALAPQDVPRLGEAAVDGRALLFALAASSLSAVLAGLAPLLLLRGTSLEEAFRSAARTVAAGRNRMRSALVVAEVAVALVMVVGAGLLARTFVNLREVPLGFEADRVLAMEVTLPDARYPEKKDWRGFHERLVAQARTVPGVESAAIVTLRPLWGIVGMDWPFTVEGQAKDEAERNPLLNFETVSESYFQTMGIPIRQGRALRETDDETQPGAIVVGEALARRFWPGQDPIGKRLKLPLPNTPFHDAWLTVVGVAGDARYRELQASRLDLYMSYRQADHRPRHLVVRGRVDPHALAEPMRELIRQLDPEVPVTDVLTMSQAVSMALGGPRFAARVFGAFALVALTLSALGLYGLLAYSVSRRTREIGIRVALGADRHDVRRLVLREGLALTGGGIAIGLAAAGLASRSLRSLLFGVGSADAATFAAGPVVLAATAVAAALLPARRAARVDPAVALRTE